MTRLYNKQPAGGIWCTLAAGRSLWSGRDTLLLKSLLRAVCLCFRHSELYLFHVPVMSMISWTIWPLFSSANGLPMILSEQDMPGSRSWFRLQNEQGHRQTVHTMLTLPCAALSFVSTLRLHTDTVTALNKAYLPCLMTPPSQTVLMPTCQCSETLHLKDGNSFIYHRIPLHLEELHFTLPAWFRVSDDIRPLSRSPSVLDLYGFLLPVKSIDTVMSKLYFPKHSTCQRHALLGEASQGSARCSHQHTCSLWHSHHPGTCNTWWYCLQTQPVFPAEHEPWQAQRHSCLASVGTAAKVKRVTVSERYGSCWLPLTNSTERNKEQAATLPWQLCHGRCPCWQSLPSLPADAAAPHSLHPHQWSRHHRPSSWPAASSPLRAASDARLHHSTAA